MPIKIKSTSGGSVTIDVPSTAVDTTMILPVTNSGLVSNNNPTISGPVLTGNVAISGASSYLNINGDNVSPYAMRNRIINGDMKVWQRGTTFTNPAWPSTTYTADRWFVSRNYSTANCSASQQTTGVTGLGKYGLRIQRTAGDVNTTGNFYVVQHIENKNMLDLQGQTVTFSGWVKFGSNFSGSSLSVALASGTGTDENYYSGYTGSTTVCSVSLSANTSYVKFTITGTVPSNSNELAVFFGYVPSGTAGANDWFEFTDIQVEQGSVATPFERRSYGLELALCQRYYWRNNASATWTYARQPCTVVMGSSTGGSMVIINPVPMRTTPVSVDFNALALYDGANLVAISNLTLDQSSLQVACMSITTSGATALRPYIVMGNGSASSYLGISAEL